MLKKLLAALMCLTMAVSFAACGDDAKEKAEETISKISEDLHEDDDEAEEETKEAEEETEDPEKAAQEIAEAEKAVAELEAEVEEEVVDSIVDEAMDNQLEVGANMPSENNDTLGLADILTSGKWDGYTIAVSGMDEMTLEDFAEMGGVDVSTMEMSIEFSADGSATLTSATATETGTYVIDAENVYMTDSTGAAVVFVYDEATGMLSLDMIGDGSMIMTFAVGQ